MPILSLPQNELDHLISSAPELLEFSLNKVKDLPKDVKMKLNMSHDSSVILRMFWIVKIIPDKLRKLTEEDWKSILENPKILFPLVVLFQNPFFKQVVKNFANLDIVVQYIHGYRNILYEMLDKFNSRNALKERRIDESQDILQDSADIMNPENIGEVTTSHSDILYSDQPNLSGTEFKIPHHVVTTGPEDYISEKKSSHSDIGIEREESLNLNSDKKFMPDLDYDLNIVDYGRGTEDGRGKNYVVTYRQGDEVNSYNPGSTSERWESFTDYMYLNGKSDSMFVCVCTCVCA